MLASRTCSFHRLGQDRGARPACRSRSRRPAPCCAISSSKVVMSLDRDDLEQLLARAGEVLAEVVVDLLAAAFELGLEEVGDQRHAAAAAGAGLGAALISPTSVQPFSAMARADRALGDVVAGADWASSGRRRRRRRGLRRRGEQDQLSRGTGELVRSASGRSDAVRGGVADQDAAEERLPVGLKHELLVDPFERVGVERPRRRLSSAKQSPKLATSTPMQLELGGHVGALEGEARRRRARLAAAISAIS